MDYFLQLLTTGIIIGGLYAMIALGFVLIFKATGVLNFAQGPMVVLGAFIVWTCLSLWEIPFFFALLLTFLIVITFACLVEKIILRPLIGRSIIATIMLTLGLYYILEGCINILWGSDVRIFPDLFPNVTLLLGPVIIPPSYFWGFIGGVASVIIFAIFFRFSRIGIAMRAVAENQKAALSMGVSAKKVIRISWAISAIVAAMGGVLLSNISGLSPRMSEIGLLMFPVVILGGLDSVPGAILGGFLIGIFENMAGGYIDPLVGGGFKEIFPFIILIIILFIRPYGLFGTHEIERL